MKNHSRGYTLACVSAAALTLVLLSGCRPSIEAASFQPANARYRIAIAEISQETNSFSPVPTTLADFEAEGIWHGGEIIDRSLGAKTAIGGFLRAVHDLGRGEVEVVPLLRATAFPGGSVERTVYERFKAEIVEGLRSAGSIDGVYLPLHGAMDVEGMRDPEGDLLEAIRSVVGPEVPVGYSFDQHANLTRRRAELATFIVGYKTNPHRDHVRTGYDATRILLAAVRGETKPVMVVRKLRLLKGGGMDIDFLPPMRSIFRRMKKMERANGVLSVSIFPVHLWLDDPELGWSTVAVTDGDPALAEKTADELADRCWAVRATPHAKGLTPEEAVAIAKRSGLARFFGTIVVCDAADTTGTGAPGDGTKMLKALLEGGRDLVSYVPVRDPAAVARLWDAPEGSTVIARVGGGLAPQFNSPVEVTGTVLRKRSGERGRSVILRSGGVHVILTELPETAATPGYFKGLGLSPWKADLVVVKNLFPFRYNYVLYNRMTLEVLTTGASDVDVHRLPYSRIPRPIYPLDEIESWR
jgi:microcystin degradation protein MlrC